eukprot:g2180.t1
MNIFTVISSGPHLGQRVLVASSSKTANISSKETCVVADEQYKRKKRKKSKSKKLLSRRGGGRLQTKKTRERLLTSESHKDVGHDESKKANDDVLDSASSTSTLPILSAEFVVGRSKRSGVALPKDTRVSESHCRIKVAVYSLSITDETNNDFMTHRLQYTIVDVGSTNGTSVGTTVLVHGSPQKLQKKFNIDKGDASSTQVTVGDSTFFLLVEKNFSSSKRTHLEMINDTSVGKTFSNGLKVSRTKEEIDILEPNVKCVKHSINSSPNPKISTSSLFTEKPELECPSCGDIITKLSVPDRNKHVNSCLIRKSSEKCQNVKNVKMDIDREQKCTSEETCSDAMKKENVSIQSESELFSSWSNANYEKYSKLELVPLSLQKKSKKTGKKSKRKTINQCFVQNASFKTALDAISLILENNRKTSELSIREMKKQGKQIATIVKKLNNRKSILDNAIQKRAEEAQLKKENDEKNRIGRLAETRVAVYEKDDRAAIMEKLFPSLLSQCSESGHDEAEPQQEKEDGTPAKPISLWSMAGTMGNALLSQSKFRVSGLGMNSPSPNVKEKKKINDNDKLSPRSEQIEFDLTGECSTSKVEKPIGKIRNVAKEKSPSNRELLKVLLAANDLSSDEEDFEQFKKKRKNELFGDVMLNSLGQSNVNDNDEARDDDDNSSGQSIVNDDEEVKDNDHAIHSSLDKFKIIGEEEAKGDDRAVHNSPDKANVINDEEANDTNDPINISLDESTAIEEEEAKNDDNAIFTSIPLSKPPGQVNVIEENDDATHNYFLTSFSSPKPPSQNVEEFNLNVVAATAVENGTPVPTEGTPCPEYDKMPTCALEHAMAGYGMRKCSRKKMIERLTNIWIAMREYDGKKTGRSQSKHTNEEGGSKGTNNDDSKNSRFVTLIENSTSPRLSKLYEKMLLLDDVSVDELQDALKRAELQSSSSSRISITRNDVKEFLEKQELGFSDEKTKRRKRRR